MRALVFILSLAGCSYTFDDTAPDIRLLGGPPNTDGLPRLNHGLRDERRRFMARQDETSTEILDDFG